MTLKEPQAATLMSSATHWAQVQINSSAPLLQVLCGVGLDAEEAECGGADAGCAGPRVPAFPRPSAWRAAAARAASRFDLAVLAFPHLVQLPIQSQQTAAFNRGPRYYTAYSALVKRCSPCKLGLAPSDVLVSHAGSSAGPGATGAGDKENAAPAAMEPDPVIVAQLMSMGFGENGSKRAAVATQVCCCTCCFAHRWHTQCQLHALFTARRYSTTLAQLNLLRAAQRIP